MISLEIYAISKRGNIRLFVQSMKVWGEEGGSEYEGVVMVISVNPSQYDLSEFLDA